MLRRAAVAFRGYPLTAWFVTVMLIFTAAFAVAFRTIHDVVRDNHKLAVQNRVLIARTVGLAAQDCSALQAGWDGKREAYLVLTAPTPFEPTNDPEQLRAEQVLNERQAANRMALLRSLGARPLCPA